MAKRVLHQKVHQEIARLLNEGILEPREIAARLDAAGFKNVGGQQISGLVTLHKRRLAGDVGFGRTQPAAPAAPSLSDLLEAPAAPPAAAAPLAPAIERPAGNGFPQDGFNWGEGASGTEPGVGGFSFGQVRMEYHISRIAPANDGFLGIEPQGFSLDHLGKKYGSGTYDVTLYVNDKKLRTVRQILSQTYGEPRTPRAGGGNSFPRLLPEGERRPSLPSSAGELSEAVKAVKDIHEITDRRGNGLEGKVLEKALDALTTKPPTGQDSTVVSVLQAQQARLDADRQLERDRWEREQTAARDRYEQERRDRDARDERERKDAEAKHQREMDRMKEEFSLRQKEADRLQAERDKRAEDDRKFYSSMEKDREKRLEEAIQATNASIQGLQEAHAADLQKEREHQTALMKIREDQLKLDRDRMLEESKTNREHMQQLYDLQLKALPNKGGTEEMICNTIKDALARADAKVTETLEVKKMQELVKLVGPENAQQLAASFLLQGGVDINKIFGQKLAVQPAAGPGGAGAPAAGAPIQPTASSVAAAAPAAAAGTVATKDALKGDGMNSIAQQVFDTPFFTDLLDIWAGHLRLKRSPFLFTNQMVEFMLEDKRVSLFYNYMAGRTWEEFWPEVKAKVPPAKVSVFETPEASKFYSDVIELISKRIEQDYVQRGIVPTGLEPAAAPEATPEKK